MRLITLILLAVLTSPLVAEIDVPSEVQSPPNPIVATVDADIPEGAQSKGRWEIEGEGEAQLIEAGDGKIYIWAQPGTYTVSYTGMWVHFEDKMFDFISEQATILVKAKEGPGPDPKPDPEPDPEPPDTLGVVIVEDVANRSRLPYGQVQSMILPGIRDMANSFRLVDKDVEGADGGTPSHLEPYLQAASKAAYPHLMLHEDGDIIWQGPVPETAEAMRDLLRQYQPEEAEEPEKVTVKPKAPTTTRYVRRTVCGPRERCYTTWEVAP